VLSNARAQRQLQHVLPSKVRTAADVHDLFEKLDLKEESKLSALEHRRFCREVIGLSQHESSDRHVRLLFGALDKKGAGEIGVSEFHEFILDCVHANTAEVAGRGYDRHDHDRARLPPLAASRSAPVLPRRNSSSNGAVSDMVRGSLSSTVSLPSMASPHVSVQSPVSAIGRASPVLGGSSVLHYARMSGADRLNLVEDRLCRGGVNLRGRFFEVGSDRPSRATGMLLDVDSGRPKMLTHMGKVAKGISLAKMEHECRAKAAAKGDFHEFLG